MRAVNVYRRLEAMIGAGAQFRGKQEAAIHAIMSGQSPVVAIMGTGCGLVTLTLTPTTPDYPTKT